MQLPQATLLLLSLAATIQAFALPDALQNPADAPSRLFKRKGGGGGRSSGSSSSSRSSASSSSRSSSSVPNTYGGGRYFAGGASVAYVAGRRSPGGISPVFLPVGALAFFPAIWLYGAYQYRWPEEEYTYFNTTTNEEETRPVECFCAQYAECGCEERGEDDFIQEVANNETISQVVDVNGTETLVINGTLSNGTAEAQAQSLGSKQALLEMSGWWLMVATVVYTVWC